jgi:hypothetical protein
MFSTVLVRQNCNSAAGARFVLFSKVCKDLEKFGRRLWKIEKKLDFLGKTCERNEHFQRLTKPSDRFFVFYLWRSPSAGT